MRNSTTADAPAARAAGALGLSSNPYGLTARELRAEITRCLDRGWQAWELRRRFATTREDHT